MHLAQDNTVAFGQVEIIAHLIFRIPEIYFSILFPDLSGRRDSFPVGTFTRERNVFVCFAVDGCIACYAVVDIIAC